MISPITTTASPFDQICQTDRDGEFWSARDLMPLLGYKQWRRMDETIDRAVVSCQAIGTKEDQHFLKKTRKTKGRGRPKQDYRLTSLAVTLLIMSSDPRKPQIAAAQTYFVAKALGLSCQAGTWNQDDKAGFVYLIRQTITPYYKIGKSKNPYKRMQTLQIGTPLELQIVSRVWSFDALQLESVLHQYFDAYRIRGEWFNLPDDLVHRFVAIATEFDCENEMALKEAEPT